MSPKYTDLGMGRIPVTGWSAIAERLEVSVQAAMTWAEEGLLPVQRDSRGDVWAYEEDLDYFAEFEKARAEASSGEVLPGSFTVNFSPEITDPEIQQILTALADYFRSCGGAGLSLIAPSEDSSGQGESDV